jgi:hypothetical protein
MHPLLTLPSLAPPLALIAPPGSLAPPLALIAPPGSLAPPLALIAPLGSLASPLEISEPAIPLTDTSSEGDPPVDDSLLHPMTSPAVAASAQGRIMREVIAASLFQPSMPWDCALRAVPE